MASLLTIENLQKGKFISRPNRYIAEVEIDGKIEIVHVHDPGRLKELLFEGNTCYVKYAASEKRKTDWDMIAAQKGDETVLIHSGYHRYLSERILKDEKLSPIKGITYLKAEVKHGNSRFDYYLEAVQNEPIWVEVKGCSLSENLVAMFPDAPTVRGSRHIEELIATRKDGTRAALLILVLSEAESFVPKFDTDPKFFKVFYEAVSAGVEIYPVKIKFEADKGQFTYEKIIPIMNKHDGEAYFRDK